MIDIRRSFFYPSSFGVVSLLMCAGYATAQPLDCFFKNKSIGHDVTAYVRNGTVECKDPDTKRLARVVEIKGGKIFNEKRYEDGLIKSDISFDNDPKNNNYHGLCKFYEKGKLSKEAIYQHGDAISEKTYFPSGKLQSHFVINDKDKNQKSRIEFDEQGLLVGLECSPVVINDKQKAWCGFAGKVEAVTLYSHGKPFKTLTYKDGKPLSSEQVSQSGVKQKTKTAATATSVGVETDYFENGKKRSEVRVNAAGQSHGPQRYFFKENGNLAAEEIYENGLVRETKVFYQNGKTKVHYKWNGKPVDKKLHGTFEEFYDDGKKESEGTCYVKANQYWAGSYESYYTLVPNGEVKNWDRDGDLVSLERFKDGRRERVSEEYFTKANKEACKLKIEYQDGRARKVQVYLKDAGTWRLKEEASYQADQSRVNPKSKEYYDMKRSCYSYSK